MRLDRFSPNFDQADRFGFARVRPIEPYAHIFAGLPDQAVANLAYYFHFDYADGRDAGAYIRPLDRAVRRWRRVHRRSELVFLRKRDRLLICDLRAGKPARMTVLAGLDRTLYEACDGVVHLNRLAALAGADAASGGTSRVVDRLQPLVDRGLLVTDGQRYLALAIPLDDYRPPAAMLARIRRLMKTLVARPFQGRGRGTEGPALLTRVEPRRQHDRSTKEQRRRRRSPQRKREPRRPPGSVRRSGRRSPR